MAGKYMRLEKYLSGLPESTCEMRLTFAQIEEILADRLPASAYEDQRWWEHETEANHVTVRAWANAGWKIGRLDVNVQWVEFVR